MRIIRDADDFGWFFCQKIDGTQGLAPHSHTTEDARQEILPHASEGLQGAVMKATHGHRAKQRDELSFLVRLLMFFRMCELLQT